MKKILALLICAICILSIGCVKNSDDNSSDTTTSSDNNVFYEDTLTNPNMLVPEWRTYDEQGSYIFEGNGDGSYNIKFLDPVSVTSSYLCSQLGCNHNSEECTSYVVPRNGCAFLAKLNGKIIVVTMGNNDTIPPSVRTMSLSGGDGKKIVEFDMSDLLMPLQHIIITGENSIYCELESASDTNGAVEVESQLVKIDIDTGKVSKILTFRPQQRLKGVVNNKFLIVEYDTGTWNVYLATQDGNMGKPIFEFKGKGEFFENKNQIYFLNYEEQKLCLLSEDGQVEEYMDIPFGGNNSYIRRICDDMIVIDNSIFNNDISDWDTTKYCIDLNTKEIRKNTFKIDNEGKILSATIQGMTRDYVIATVGYTYKEMTGFDKDGNIDTYTVDTPVLGKFTFDDFFSDRMVYQTFENI